MQSYPDNTQRVHLRSEHKHQIFVESGIDPVIAAERGYTTIKSRSELLSFKKYQRRPGLYIPTSSPDGVTTGAQLKPNNPRKDKKGKSLKYETPGGSEVILDVHPRMRDEVRDGDGDLCITEGIKKADSLTSRGLPTVGLIGVWNWQRDGALLPCWDHVRLDGRTAYVVFDSDVMVKAEVQLALERLVAALEARCADVRVVYLPDGEDGEKVGVDDYLAAGGTVAELKMLARKFEPADVGRIRLSRDEKLRAALGELRAAWWGADWTRMIGTGKEPHWMGSQTMRDVEDALLRLAARSGKLTSEGVRFTVGTRTIAEEAEKGKPATGKALKHLQAEGRLLIHEPRDRRKARSYTLLRGRADCYHNGEGDAGEGKVTQGLQVCNPRGNGLRAPDVSRLRWSAPAQKKRRVKRKEAAAGRVRTVSEVVGKDRPRIERLGPHRGALVDYLEAAGGVATLAELCDVLHKSRPRDVRRRMLPILEEAGIIECEGDVIALARDWRDKLEARRRDDGEIVARERQKARHKEERRQFKLFGPTPPAEEPPAQMDPEKVAEIVRDRAREDVERRMEEQRRKVGVTAETFVYDRLKELGRIRLGLLREVYQDAGGNPSDVLSAAVRLGCHVERLPECDNHQFIFPPTIARSA